MAITYTKTFALFDFYRKNNQSSKVKLLTFFQFVLRNVLIICQNYTLAQVFLIDQKKV